MKILRFSMKQQILLNYHLNFFNKDNNIQIAENKLTNYEKAKLMLKKSPLKLREAGRNYIKAKKKLPNNRTKSTHSEYNKKSLSRNKDLEESKTKPIIKPK
mmetsp:Transcript_22525/g.20009  ORF Transcript_22525/g.20009 Transcript_22525/m.20009 type:complete len:101 (+) Transcript_22525:79-381(+)